MRKTNVIQEVLAQYSFTQYSSWYSTVLNRTKQYEFPGFTFDQDFKQKNPWKIKIRIEKNEI